MNELESAPLPEPAAPEAAAPEPAPVVSGRVAVVSHSHPSLSKGGAEISAYALYRGLRTIGIDAIFIAACSVADRARLLLADDHEFAVYVDPDSYSHFFHLSAPDVASQLVDIIRGQGVAVVNFHHFLNLGLNSLRAVRALPGVRCLLTLHEFLAICHHHGQMVTRPAQVLCQSASADACTTCFPEHMRSHFVLRRETVLATLAEFDGFVSPSRFLSERFVAWGLPAERIHLIENGLLHLPDSAVAPAKSSGVIGFFGQINPFKGVDVILDAAELIAQDETLAAEVRVRIHGNLVGQSPAFVERFEKALADYPFLSYSGPYSSALVSRLMSECDYVLVPSRWWENSPVVIQEAYAVGVPVICTGVGGLAEKVPDGVSGLHFRLGDAPDLVRALRRAIRPQMLNTLRGGVPPVYSAVDMAHKYATAFASLDQAGATLAEEALVAPA